MLYFLLPPAHRFCGGGEDFQRFWNYKSAGWAAKFLDDWCKRTMRSRIDPMKKIARMLRSHRGLILNWFRAKELIALGAVEGLNNKAKVTVTIQLKKMQLDKKSS